MTDKDLYGGLIRLHILHYAAKESVFGLGLIEELRHLPRLLERQVGVRRFRWLQSRLRERHDRNRLHGSRPP